MLDRRAKARTYTALINQSKHTKSDRRGNSDYINKACCVLFLYRLCSSDSPREIARTKLGCHAKLTLNYDPAGNVGWRSKLQKKPTAKQAPNSKSRFHKHMF